MKNYYEVLDLSHDASEEMIKKRYRQLSFMNHPDRYFSLDDPDLKAFAEEKFKEINEAYGVLGKPKKRANYDKQFHSGKSRYQEPDTKPRGGYQEPDTSWQDDYHSPQWNQILVSLLVMINQMIKQGKWRNAKEALYVFGGLGYRPKGQPPIGLIDRNHPKWQIALKLNKAANSSIILPVITLGLWCSKMNKRSQAISGRLKFSIRQQNRFSKVLPEFCG